MSKTCSLYGRRLASAGQNAQTGKLVLAPGTCAARGRSVRPTYAMMDFIKKFFDLNNKTWAPKSTRIWRLQQYEYPGDDPAQGAEPTAADMVNQLEAKVNSLPPSARPALPTDESDMPSDMRLGSNATASTSSDVLDNTRSFSDSEDSELAWALNRRISQIATSAMSPEGMENENSQDMDEPEEQEPEVEPLTAEELRKLIRTKYDKTYDVSIVRRDIPGKTFVCLNIMWTHLEQRSFQMTEEQYMDKLDGIAYLLNALEQTEKVRSVLKETRRSQKGLPARPVVGTAISILLDVDKPTIDEWFGRGYQ